MDAVIVGVFLILCTALAVGCSIVAYVIGYAEGKAASKQNKES